jgi:hypothetical protein
MQEIRINLSGDQQQKEIEEIIETACKTQDLFLVSKNTLQKYPGCIHWHYQRIKTAGTLEITYWPTQNRCWFPLRDGRAKPWVVETVKKLKVEIESRIKNRDNPSS